MTINSKVFEPGTLTSAADANQPHEDIVTASAAIGADATRTEWASFKHITTSGKDAHPITPYMGKVEDATHFKVYDNTAYATIEGGAGGTPMALTGLPITLTAGQTLRLHAGCFVTEVTHTDVTADYYWFRLVAEIAVDGGAAGTVQLTPDWGYSLGSTRSGEGFVQTYGYQRVGLSWVHVCKNTEEIISEVDFQVKLEDASNDITIAECHLIAIKTTA